MPIRAITFDFWNTLFRDANGEPRQRIRIDALARAANRPHAETAAALDAVWKEFGRAHREDQRTLAPQDAVRMACEFLNAEVAAPLQAELAEVFAKAILLQPAEPIEGALDAVRAAAAVLPVGLISDTGVSPGSSLRVLLDRNAFTPHFRSMVFSDIIGVAKPQRPMFAASAEDLGVGIDELFHIGDLDHTDIAGAKAAGSMAALFCAANASDAGRTHADYIFNDWAEFIALLPRLLD